MAFRALFLACILLLVSASALAQRGPPGGGPPGGQGRGGARGGPGAGSGGPGGPSSPGGPGGKPPHGNATGNYNLLVQALLVDAAGSPPDSLAIVKGAVCDAAATDVLALPLAAADWQQRAGWWLLHAEARLDAFLENADAATLDALLAVLPNASLPRTSGGGRNGGGSAGARGADRVGGAWGGSC
ncbi:unnamed protein product [Closterium sp. NIES-64]|nr:unnamed protein product [Closterium sp. NIES-64]